MTPIEKALTALGNEIKAKSSARFFKTRKGEYGEGDIFIGVTIPEQRKVAKRFLDTPLVEIEKLLKSKEHEFRMTALIILVEKFKKGKEAERENIYDLYIRNTKWINNWDLVDVSAEYIVGGWLEGRSDKMSILLQLANSNLLWERRVAMIATFAYIKKGNSKEALKIAETLLVDTHDLIRKAVGWMLREVGKRCDREIEELFLKKHYEKISRTTLRYAIEHFSEEKRRAYLVCDK